MKRTEITIPDWVNRKNEIQIPGWVNAKKPLPEVEAAEENELLETVWLAAFLILGAIVLALI